MQPDPEFSLTQVKIDYDATGEFRTFLTKSGRPEKGANGEYAQRYVDQPKTNSRLEWEYDRRGDIIDGDENGSSGYFITYNKAGNVLKKFFLDNQARRIVQNNGCWEFRYKFDRNDLQTEWSAYDSLGKPVKDGAATVKTVRDESGEILSERQFDYKGSVLNSNYHAASIFYTRDRFGYATGCSSYGSEGALRRRTEHVFDSLGNILSEKVYGADNQLLATKGWYQWEYDTLGLVTRFTTFARDGSFETALIYKHDERGNCVVCSDVDKDGVEVDNNFGYASTCRKYDDDDNEIEDYFVNARGVPCVRRSDGAARVVVKYNSLGLSTALRYQDMSGQPVASSDQNDHAATIISSYDKWGVALSQERYDVKGNLIVPRAESDAK